MLHAHEAAPHYYFYLTLLCTFESGDRGGGEEQEICVIDIGGKGPNIIIYDVM